MARANKQPEAAGIVPEWAAGQRVLRYDGQVVKRFKVPAPTQEAILAAFQEEGWPTCIDDPLPPDGKQHPKQRLGATIRSLNGHHLVKLIEFHGNGTGTQVYWEVVAKRPKARKRRRR